jgi:hypothetical protein
MHYREQFDEEDEGFERLRERERDKSRRNARSARQNAREEFLDPRED